MSHKANPGPDPSLAASRFSCTSAYIKRRTPGLYVASTTTTPEPAYHPALSNINTSNCTHTSTRSKLIHYSAASSTTMEASQHNTLQIIQNYVKTPSIEVVPPKTIKMEDITSTTTSSSLLDVPSLDCASRGAESKPTKKRKSWGQVLPEPKTNLPPRKVHKLKTKLSGNEAELTHGSAQRQQTRKSSDG